MACARRPARRSKALTGADGHPPPARRHRTSRSPLTGAYRRDRDGAVTGRGALPASCDPGRPTDGDPSGIEIVSTVSHELRSPLTSVKGYTGLLLNRWDRLPDDQKRMMLEQVNHDADRVTRLIAELLDISRLEAGRLALRRQLVDLPRLAAERGREGCVSNTRRWRPAARLSRRVPEGVRRSRQDRAGPDQPGRERLQVRLPARAAHRGGRRPQAAVSVARPRPGRGDPGGGPAEGVHQVLPPVTRPPDRVRPRAVDQPGPGRSPTAASLVAESNSTARARRFGLPFP